MTEETKTIIARLILNTRRINRPNNLIEIATDILTLKERLGSLGEVGKAIGLKQDMLNRFLAILKLETEVQKLFKERKLDSVFTGYYLKSFNRQDQLDIANAIINKKLNSNKVRVLAPLRKKFPNENINELIQKVIDSKDSNIYLIHFEPKNDDYIAQLKKRISNILPLNEFVIEIKNNLGIIKISENGYNIIRQIAKEKKQTPKQYLSLIIK